MKKEIWKDIKEYEGCYQISDLGQVKSLERIVASGKGYRTVKEKCLSQNVYNTSGYRQVGLNKNNKYKIITIHKLVALHFVEGYEEGLTVNHIDGNKLNNHYSNLEWISYVDNLRHAHDNNIMTFKKGIHSPNSRLTHEDVVDIINMLNLGIYQKHIAEKHKVCRSVISKINTNREAYLK